MPKPSHFRNSRGQWRTVRKNEPTVPVGLDLHDNEISGTIEDMTFHSDETGYTVCQIKPAKSTRDSDRITLVGKCTSIWIGEEVRAKGQWVRHPQHGLQFQADKILCIAPTSAEGIKRYLSSGMIKGIGKVNAERIVDHFGERTLEILDKESARLEEIEGIGPQRRKMIKESWTEQRGIHEVMIFLQSNGIGIGQSSKIFRRYGSDAVAIVKQNPYRLCRDVWGIGFKTADAIALKVGIPMDSEMRARASLHYALDVQKDEGHCYDVEADLVLHARELVNISVEILADALQKEILQGFLVRKGERIYLRAMLYAEQHTADKLLALLDAEPSFRAIPPEKAIPWAEERSKIQLAQMQRVAIETALRSKVSIITGGPGVGKTTIIKTLVDIYGARRLNVKLAAPTGRASRRMSESTGMDAQTIHRLLKYNPARHGFDYDSQNNLEGDVFIVDESSMIDIELAQSFLEALPDSATVIFVGDTDQLPSVGPGNVLRDMIASKRIPCTRLDTIFRQRTGGLIVRNAHNVNNGQWLEAAAPGEPTDFFFVQSDDPEDTLRKIVDLVSVRIPRKFGFVPLSDMQVLTPMRRNPLGTENLNMLLQERLNPEGISVQRSGRMYRVGDRVMQMRNNYDKDVFNGDIGFIRAIDTESNKVTVAFDDREAKYEFHELDELVHAYACSIHKSQGSEFPAVVIALANQHFMLLQRNLLYTAITRGRKLVCLVGSKWAIQTAIDNNQIRERRTALAELLRNGRVDDPIEKLSPAEVSGDAGEYDASGGSSASSGNGAADESDAAR